MVSLASQKGSGDTSCSYRIFPSFTWGETLAVTSRLSLWYLEVPNQAGRTLALKSPPYPVPGLPHSVFSWLSLGLSV